MSLSDGRVPKSKPSSICDELTYHSKKERTDDPSPMPEGYNHKAEKVLNPSNASRNYADGDDDVMAATLETRDEWPRKG